MRNHKGQFTQSTKVANPAGQVGYLLSQLAYQEEKLAYCLANGYPTEKVEYHKNKIEYIKGKLKGMEKVEE